MAAELEAADARPALRGARSRSRAGRALLGERRPPAGLLAAGLAVAAIAGLPAAYLVIVAGGDVSAAWSTVADGRTLSLALRSLGLAAAVVVSATAIAVPLAWLTARSDLPARRLWATLATLPLVIPSYIGAYLFVAALGPRGVLQDLLGIDRLPSIYGFLGAWLVLTLFTYPLILLTTRAALMRLDPGLEDAARAMGRTPAQAFRSVVLPQVFPAIGAGALLVALYVMSDFGAVSIMRFNTFTREIYLSYRASFDRTSAAALGCVLILLMIALLYAYGRARDRLAPGRAAGRTTRPPPQIALGAWRWPAIGFCAAIVTVALVLPVAVLVWWLVQGVGSGADVSRAASLAGNSALVGGLSGVAAAVGAIVIAVLAVRFPGPIPALIERASYAGYALPGIVVALALVFFSIRVVPELYQTLALLVIALSAHYLPLAVGAVGASLLLVSPRVEEAARGLGRGPVEVFRTITTPLTAGGIAAGAALVFLHAVKELPATLLLAPTGFETLATDIWRQTSLGLFEAGALPALILLIVSAPPLYLLTARGEIA